MLQPKAQCASVWLVVMFNHVQAHANGKTTGMSSTAVSTNATTTPLQAEAEKRPTNATTPPSLLMFFVDTTTPLQAEVEKRPTNAATPPQPSCVFCSHDDAVAS